MADHITTLKRASWAKPLKWALILFNVVMLFVVGWIVYGVVATPAPASAYAFPAQAYIPPVIAVFVWSLGTFLLGISLGLATGKLKPVSNFGSDRSGYSGNWGGDSGGFSD